jgi:hypothetical protein
MENKIEKALDNFVDQPETEVEKAKVEDTKKVILNKREGLIERIDRVFVDETGRQLLREQY